MNEKVLEHRPRTFWNLEIKIQNNVSVFTVSARVAIPPTAELIVIIVAGI